jgi:hypothetical protein
LDVRPEDDAEEDMDAKRRRILEETRDIDADSDTGSDEDSTEDDRLVDRWSRFKCRTNRASDDDEDETAELQRELEKIKRERAEKREQEVRIKVKSLVLSCGWPPYAGAREGSCGRGCKRTRYCFRKPFTQSQRF